MPFSACIRCADCDGFPCLVHAKSDAEVLAVRPALAAPQRHAADGRAGRSKLETERRGHRGDRGRRRPRRRASETYRRVSSSSSCGAANSARLLLASANDKHPRGLANGSDQVGRNYMFHNSDAVLAISKEPNPTRYQKTLGLNDFYFGTPRLRLPAGQHPDGRQVAGADVPGEKPIAQAGARCGRSTRSPSHAVDFWLSTEDLPRPDNRVTLERDGSIRSATRRTTRCRRRSSTTSSSRCSNHLGMHPEHLIPRNLYMKNEHRHRRASRIRRAPAGSAPIRRPRCST